MRDNNDRDETLNLLHSYFSTRDDVLLVLLFGSFGTGQQHPLSDIDIAVLLKNDIPLMEELKMAADLSLLLDRDDVDLVFLRKASVNIAHRALSTGRVIFERDQLLTADFVEATINHYRDFGYRLRQIDADFAEKLREDYV
jgi:predicted nucleotidyltransferase